MALILQVTSKHPHKHTTIRVKNTAPVLKQTSQNNSTYNNIGVRGNQATWKVCSTTWHNKKTVEYTTQSIARIL